MTVLCRYPFLLLLLTLAACDSGVDPPGDQPEEEVVAPFRTDSLLYVLRQQPLPDEYSGRSDWGVMYNNRSDSTVFFLFTNTCGVYVPPNCGSWDPWPIFERLTGGNWIPAMSSARVAVGTAEVHPVAAGDSLELSHRLSFPGRSFEFNTGLPIDSIAGTYRLRYLVYGNPGPDARGPRENDLLPIEDRVSNEFRLTVRASD